MSTSITIRNVPDDTHAELASRAALAGQSLQEYLRGQLVRMAKQPDAASLMSRIEKRLSRSDTRVSSETILEYRDADRP